MKTKGDILDMIIDYGSYKFDIGATQMTVPRMQEREATKLFMEIEQELRDVYLEIERLKNLVNDLEWSIACDNV